MFWRDDAEVTQLVDEGGDGHTVGLVEVDELVEGDCSAMGAAHLFVEGGLGKEEATGELAAEALLDCKLHIAGDIHQDMA